MMRGNFEPSFRGAGQAREPGNPVTTSDYWIPALANAVKLSQTA